MNKVLAQEILHAQVRVTDLLLDGDRDEILSSICQECRALVGAEHVWAALKLSDDTGCEVIVSDGSAEFKPGKRIDTDSLSKEHHIFALRRDNLTLGHIGLKIDRLPAPKRFGIELLAQMGTIAIQKQTLARHTEHKALHDNLTELPNRQKFDIELNAWCSTAQTEEQRFAVLLVDLDEFKTVNDSLGHVIGDELLIAVTARLRNVVGEDGVLYRMGGDEFAVIVPLPDRANAHRDVSGRLIEALRDEVELNDIHVRVGASIGVSRFPHDGQCAVELLRCADIAMYQAKAHGKNTVQVYNSQLTDRYRLRLDREIALKRAIEGNHLQLVYQPQVAIQSNKVITVEALVRWTDPQEGPISPTEFIPMAEESGLINPLGDWVLDEACRQVAYWEQVDNLKLRVAVNISAQQFHRNDFTRTVHETLRRHQLAPYQLELEVTENVVMTDMERVIRELSILRNAGINIALDDFGTGYSSLQYLQHLPLDTLKIDRAFIQGLEDGHSGYSLVNTIMFLAKSFNLETVAEGVETMLQLMRLTSMGCDQIQGYYFSRPVSGNEMPATLDSIQARWASIRKAS